jgi:hypothetical protein
VIAAASALAAASAFRAPTLEALIVEALRRCPRRGMVEPTRGPDEPAGDTARRECPAGDAAGRPW